MQLKYLHRLLETQWAFEEAKERSGPPSPQSGMDQRADMVKLQMEHAMSGMGFMDRLRHGAVRNELAHAMERIERRDGKTLLGTIVAAERIGNGLSEKAKEMLGEPLRTGAEERQEHYLIKEFVERTMQRPGVDLSMEQEKLLSILRQAIEQNDPELLQKAMSGERFDLSPSLREEVASAAIGKMISDRLEDPSLTEALNRHLSSLAQAQIPESQKLMTALQEAAKELDEEILHDPENMGLKEIRTGIETCRQEAEYLSGMTSPAQHRMISALRHGDWMMQLAMAGADHEHMEALTKGRDMIRELINDVRTSDAKTMDAVLSLVQEGITGLEERTAGMDREERLIEEGLANRDPLLQRSLEAGDRVEETASIFETCFANDPEKAEEVRMAIQEHEEIQETLDRAYITRDEGLMEHAEEMAEAYCEKYDVELDKEFTEKAGEDRGRTSGPSLGIGQEEEQETYEQ